LVHQQRRQVPAVVAVQAQQEKGEELGEGREVKNNVFVLISTGTKSSS
jgi:hypothetical protein